MYIAVRKEKEITMGETRGTVSHDMWRIQKILGCDPSLYLFYPPTPSRDEGAENLKMVKTIMTI